jgi:hypothetical protein
MHHRAVHFALCVKQNQKQNIKKNPNKLAYSEKRKKAQMAEIGKKHSPNSSQNKKKRF